MEMQRIVKGYIERLSKFKLIKFFTLRHKKNPEILVKQGFQDFGFD